MTPSTLPQSHPSSPAFDSPAAGMTAAEFPRPELREFDYRPIPLLAGVAFFLGIASFLALLGLFGLVVAAVGLLVSAAALWRILRSRGQLGGQVLAGLGLAFSAVFLLSGAYFQYSDYKAELPPGYLRVNFPRDIADKKFVQAEYDGKFFNELRRELHPDVKPLEDQKVFLKGYMWQTKSLTGLDSFILLKDNGQCCFGGNPAPHDMILVQMQEGRTVDYINGLVAVAGVLRCHPEAGEGEPVYVLEGFHCTHARTSF